MKKMIRMIYIIIIEAILILALVMMPSWLISGNLQTINPDALLIGNSAVDESEIIYSKNPASIGVIKSGVLYETFNLKHNQERIHYSQNLLFPLSSSHTILAGASLINNKTISLEDSMFRANYAFRLFDILYIGAKLSYVDKYYKNIASQRLTTDLGLLVNFPVDNVVKYFNFGIYSLDANIEKINLKFPSTNLGRYSAFGFSFRFNMSHAWDLVLSSDIDLVRDNKILNRKNKYYKYGAQIHFQSIPLLKSVRGTVDYSGGDSIRNILYTSEDYSVGATFDLKLFDLTYAYNYNSITRNNKQIVSASFKLMGSDGQLDDISSREIKKIKIYPVKKYNGYKIIIIGDTDDIHFWHLYIFDEQNNIIRDLKPIKGRDSELHWDMRDEFGRKVPNADYTFKFVTIRKNGPMTVNKLKLNTVNTIIY